jgi:ABC-type branched-subunit amino acid transport system substrate-binding protein
VFAGVAASCRRDHRPIVIGYAFPLATSATAHVAQEEIAATRTPHDPDITIVLDSITQGDPPDVEVQRAQHLASVPGLVGVVGHGGSRGSLVAAAVYNEAKVPQVVPTSTSRLLATAGPWTFQLPPNDSVEGAFIGAFAATALRARRVIVFYVNDEYGAGLRDGVVAELGRRNVAVLGQVSFENASDFPTLVAAALRRGVPDALVVAGRQVDTGKIAKAAWRMAPGLRVVAGDGALVLPALADAAGPAADSIYGVAFWLADAPDSLSRAFVARFRRLAGREPQSAEAMTHDALQLLVTAARTVGPNRAAVRDYLSSLGHARPPFLGVTGPISFVRDQAPRLVMARLHGHSLVRATPP